MSEPEIDALMAGQEDENGSVHYEGTFPFPAACHIWSLLFQKPFLLHTIYGHLPVAHPKLCFLLHTLYGHSQLYTIYGDFLLPTIYGHFLLHIINIWTLPAVHCMDM